MAAPFLAVTRLEGTHKSSILIAWFRLAGVLTFHQDTGRGINGLDLFPTTDDDHVPSTIGKCRGRGAIRLHGIGSGIAAPRKNLSAETQGERAEGISMPIKGESPRHSKWKKSANALWLPFEGAAHQTFP